MNQEKIDELVRFGEQRREAEARAKKERIAKYKEAVEVDKATTTKVLALFDAVGETPESGERHRSHSFTLGETGNARTNISIFNICEHQPGPAKRGWFGIEKPGPTIYVGTGRIDVINITTTIDGESVESHSIHPSRQVHESEEGLRGHFSYVRSGRVPYIAQETSDNVLEHVRNVAETIDLLVAQYSPEKSDTNA